MDFNAITELLNESCSELIYYDKYLLDNNIHERTISHRLALFLTPKFPDFDVDCEYNGDVDNNSQKKYIKLLEDDLKSLDIKEYKENSQRLIYPDIVVHKRSRNDYNQLIIEMKKNRKQDLTWDEIKLKRFTSHNDENHYQYKYGVLIILDDIRQGNFESILWFQDGNQI